MDVMFWLGMGVGGLGERERKELDRKCVQREEYDGAEAQQDCAL